MEESVLKRFDDNEFESEMRIRLPRVMSHSIHCAVSEILPALEAVITLRNVPLDIQRKVLHAQLVAREITSKMLTLAELFGETDYTSLPKVASYELEKFLIIFTEHLNNYLKGKTDGRVSYVIDPDSDDNIICDAKRVATILYHLVSNSIQHGKTNNKNVKLICKSVGDTFELIVRDYGGGIPEEIQPMIFSGFPMKYNLDQNEFGLLPPRIQGLGLPLCMQLTKDMDGEISFKNYRAGTQFTITLPQKARGMQEVSVFTPDDFLIQKCMSSLFLYLEEKDGKGDF